MKFEWKIPHDFYPRLAQALVTAGAAGLLYAGVHNNAGAYTPAILPLTAETGYAAENKTSKESETAADAAPESETIYEAVTDTASESETNSKGTAKRESDSETRTTEISETEPLSTAEESSDRRMETEISESDLKTEISEAESDTKTIKTETADSDGKYELYVIEEYTDRAPLANPESAFSVLQYKFSELIQFQPNYLDLTEISLSWEHLEEELTSMTESYSGNWSVYVKNLSNGEVININQNPMESASLIKLYIMGAVMEQIHSGELEETEKIDSLLREMITVSDNAAANELVRYLSKEHDHKDGLTYLNSFAERHGFSDTRQVNGLEDSSLRHDPSMINKTSARDCGELLAQIYDGTLVSHLSSRKMEDLLLAQEITYKIPSALPDEAVSASKTGEVSDAENDSAIIYSPGGDFILCIMSGKWDSGNQAITHIREITKMVYNHFNPPETVQVSVSE